MTYISLPRKSKLANIATRHGRFVITANNGLAFVFKNRLAESVEPMHQVLLDEGENIFEIVATPPSKFDGPELGVDVTPDRFDIVVKGRGELVQAHKATAGDIVVNSEGRYLVGLHKKNKGYPNFINIDDGLSKTDQNGYTLRFSEWELVAYMDDVEAFRVKRPSPVVAA